MPDLKQIKQKAEAHIKEQAEKISDMDIKKVIDEQDYIKEKVQKNGYLDRFFNDISLFSGLVKDYYLGRYTKVPYKTIAAIVVGLLYIINPIDFIPDFIPIIGYIDDAMVVALCLKLVESDLEKYQAWRAKAEQNKKPATQTPVTEAEKPEVMTTSETATDAKDA